MKIEQGKTIYGGTFLFLRMGLVKGRNWFFKQGFEPCPNPLYVKRGEEHFHYNKNMGVWCNL